MNDEEKAERKALRKNLSEAPMRCPYCEGAVLFKVEGPFTETLRRAAEAGQFTIRLISIEEAEEMAVTGQMPLFLYPVQE